VKLLFKKQFMYNFGGQGGGEWTHKNHHMLRGASWSSHCNFKLKYLFILYVRSCWINECKLWMLQFGQDPNVIFPKNPWSFQCHFWNAFLLQGCHMVHRFWCYLKVREVTHTTFSPESISQPCAVPIKPSICWRYS